jgi:hypothetical protein
MAYQVNFGDTIGDVVLNTTGVIGNWELFLQENEFGSWTPDLKAGDFVQIPLGVTNDLETIRALGQYRICNSSSQYIYGLIEEIFAKLLNLSPVDPPVILPNVVDTNTYYKVRYGETITDVILNATGNIINWEDILFQNEFDWVPKLIAGQLVAIPQSVESDLNAYRALTKYPVNNNSENNVYEQIDAIFELLNGSNNWILADSFWNDFGQWYDTSFWID